MATLATDARNAAANAVVDLLDGGTIEIQASNDDVLATLTLGTPAFGDAAVGVATANAITPDSSADGTGTATKFRAKDSGGDVVFSGTVGTSAADIILVTTSIVATQPVQLTSLTYEQPAS